MSFLLSFFYIYDPWLFHFFRMAFFAGVVAIGFALVKLYRKEWQISGFWLPLDSLYAVLALIAVSAIPVLAHGTKDFSVVAMYTKLLILFGFGVVIFNLYYRHTHGQQRVIRELTWGINIQAAVGFLALLGVPFIVDLLLGTNASMPRFFGSEQEYRLYNITSSAFFQLSLFYVMLVHFLLAYNAKHDTIPSVFLFLVLCIGLISGRTFLFLSAVSILLYFKWRYIPSLVAFAALILFLAIYMPENRYVEHALEPLINFLQGKDHLSSSTDTLMKKHLYIPELHQILVGDGYYFTQDGRYYGSTDSGFIRQTLYGGFAYMLACFAFTFYFVRRVAQNWFNGSWKFILSALFLLGVCNVKADTFAFPGIMFVLLMFLSFFGEHGKSVLFLKQKESKNV